MTNKEKVLVELKTNAPPGAFVTYNFLSLSKKLNLRLEELDEAINELEKERLIDQAVLASTNEFRIAYI